jgi:Holliday junction resolvasome RuvABC endonuclease subunit
VNLLGIDLGTRKVALAVFVESELVQAYVHETPEEMARDLQLRELGGLAHDIGQLHGTDSVWIEDTIIGNNRKYSIQLGQVMGAVLAGMGHLRLSQGTDIQRVDNRVWKREVLGKGHASKDEVKDYIVVTYPAYAPLCGDDQDLYDAACIGLYGLQVTRQAGELHL